MATTYFIETYGCEMNKSDSIDIALSFQTRGFEEVSCEDDADVIGALTALGFSIVEAQRALQQLDRDSALSLDEKIRQALTYLGQ